MNWRQLVILYAAQILEQFGEHDLAKALRNYRVPLLDGGGVFEARRDEKYDWRVGATWQHLKKPDQGTRWLLPLPAALWDPPKEEQCCNHECCRKRAS